MLIGLIVLPGLLLAQTENIKLLPTNVVPAQTTVSPDVVCTQEAKLCSDGSYVGRTGPNCEFAPCPSSNTTKPIPAPISLPPPTNTATPPVSTTAIKKCGVNTYHVSNECGLNAFKGAYVQCYDGYEENLGVESSCKSSEVWQKYAQEVCANRCSVVTIPQPIPGPEQKPLPTLVPKPVPLAKPVAICYILDKLTKDYNQLILELRKAEEAGDKELANAIIQKITALKLEIESARKECLSNTAQPPSIQVPTEAPRPLAPVAVDRCAEVNQWENKIAYYKKLVSLSDNELKETSGFTREEVEKILAQLPQGLVKVKAQCDNQETTGVKPTEAVKKIIAVPVKPVAVESGQEVTNYYKAKIESITAEGDVEKQVTKLKSLKAEIDELIAKLIKGRKEIEASELGGVVSEVKISRGEIKADDVAIKTTDKKILVNVGDKPLSIAPEDRQVVITDGNLEVEAKEISIKDNALLVGNSPVNLAASQVVKNLGVSPEAVELKEENARAVYKLKVTEPRKLFGFIPISIAKTITADAESGNFLYDRLPWWSFLTTRK